MKEIAYTKNGQKEEVEVKNVKSQIRKWIEDCAVRGSMYSSNTYSDFQFRRSVQTWKLLCNKMKGISWKLFLDRLMKFMFCDAFLIIESRAQSTGITIYEVNLLYNRKYFSQTA